MHWSYKRSLLLWDQALERFQTELWCNLLHETISYVLWEEEGGEEGGEGRKGGGGEEGEEGGEGRKGGGEEGGEGRGGGGGEGRDVHESLGTEKHVLTHTQNTHTLCTHNTHTPMHTHIHTLTTCMHTHTCTHTHTHAPYIQTNGAHPKNTPPFQPLSIPTLQSERKSQTPLWRFWDVSIKPPHQRE